MTDTVPAAPDDLYELRLLFDGYHPAQVRWAALVHALDVWHQVELTDVSAGLPGPTSGAETAQAAGPPASGAAPAPRLRLVTCTGETLTGYVLFEHLVRQVRLLGPLALLTWVPGVARLGRRWYPGEPEGSVPATRETRRSPRDEKGSQHIQAKGRAGS